MTAINSHVVLPIVRDSARYEPDAFVAYLGNNEVVGPYGPGTVFGQAAPSLPLLRSTLALGGSRTGQLFRRTIAATPLAQRKPQSWRGMEMFLDQRVAADDPRLEQAYRSFEANLGSIALAARSARP